METEKKIVNDFASFLVELAIEEGKKFEIENGRKPTEQEASRIAEIIMRQGRTAIAMVK